MPEFKWVNTIIGNVKNALHGTFHAISKKHFPRYLAEFCYRFNRRYNLEQMVARFGYVAGPAILLLHGVGDSALDWQWIMPRLADRFRLIAPDLPGYSIGAGNGIVHTPANYSRLLWMFVTALPGNCPVPRRN